MDSLCIGTRWFEFRWNSLKFPKLSRIPLQRHSQASRCCSKHRCYYFRAASDEDGETEECVPEANGRGRNDSGYRSHESSSTLWFTPLSRWIDQLMGTNHWCDALPSFTPSDSCIYVCFTLQRDFYFLFYSGHPPGNVDSETVLEL